MFSQDHARAVFGGTRVNLKTMLAGWAVAEVLAFALVVKLVGVGGAVLLGICTSLIGLIMIRRIGFGATQRLRAALAGGTPPQGALLDGMLEGVGALLLILPGFVSDIAGLALASPSIRQRIALRFGGVGDKTGPVLRRPTRPAASDVIDLSPGDWRVIDRADPR